MGTRWNYQDIYAARDVSDSKYFLTLLQRKCAMFAGAPATVSDRRFLEAVLSSTATPPDPIQLGAWLNGAARRDAAAFRSLYEASAPRLYGLALRILRRRELAEEVLQESFVSIWNSARDYDSALSAPMTWMTTIVRNKAFDLLRRTRESVDAAGDAFDETVLAALRDPGATPIEALQISSDAKALANCMAALEERHRRVLGMAFFHDLSYSDVAQQLGLPIGTVKTWVRRSLTRLHSCLSGKGLS